MIKDKIETRQVNAGGLLIGGGAPVSIQSMTNVPIDDVAGTVKQINELDAAGAQLVRIALRNEEAVSYIPEILKAVKIPVCADIHFNYKIALGAIKAGVHKIRLNPGNIGDESKVKEVVAAAKERNIPIRIGVNSGSVDRKKYGEVTPQTLTASALEHIVILENCGFFDIVVSIKSSDIYETIEANMLLSKERNYPIHVGLTEAGYGMSCIVQSSIAIGHLLMNGVGDTIRVSMTGNPVDEIPPAKRILETLGKRFTPVKIISCPTCGRTDTNINILSLAENTEREIISRFGKELAVKNRTLHIAVMGCEVNGPGEARDADAGLAGGRNGSMTLFANGEIIKRVQYDSAIDELMKQIEGML
jgi:(E)-4-hydroxy-3-methylbut-2-enyl-diphosphate synthase